MIQFSVGHDLYMDAVEPTKLFLQELYSEAVRYTSKVLSSRLHFELILRVMEKLINGQFMIKSISGNKQKKTRIPLYFSLFLIALSVVCYFTIPSFNQFIKESWSVLTSDDEVRIRMWVEGFGWFGPVMIIIAMVAQMFLLVIPSIVLMIVAVLAFGAIWGSIISLISVALASTVGYLIGRQLGTSLVTSLLDGKTFKKVGSFLGKYGFWAVAITRVNPFLSNDAISFVTGILKMNFWRFIGATLLGISPLIFLIAITGKNTDSLKLGLLWGSIASILIFAAYVWWDKRRKKKSKHEAN